MRMDRTCIGCGSAFTTSARDVERGRGKYCSSKCSFTKLINDNRKNPPLAAGDRFQMLTLIEPIAKGRNPTWRVKCDCGVIKITRGSRFFGVRPLMSCGCSRKPRNGNPFAATRNKLYPIWRSMIGRTKDMRDHLYGGRGIKVCDRWTTGENGKTGFECFAADMGDRPSLNHSIDRYPNNDGNYEPGNCRWATAKEQARNRRQNIFVNIAGKRLCLLDAVPLLNPSMDYDTVLGRLDKGWPLREAIHLPKMPGMPLRKRVSLEPGNR